MNETIKAALLDLNKRVEKLEDELEDAHEQLQGHEDRIYQNECDIEESTDQSGCNQEAIEDLDNRLDNVESDIITL